jgi:hypothetical protein
MGRSGFSDFTIYIYTKFRKSGLLGEWVDPDFRILLYTYTKFRKSGLLGDWVDPDFRNFRILKQYF